MLNWVVWVGLVFFFVWVSCFVLLWCYFGFLLFGLVYWLFTVVFVMFEVVDLLASYFGFPVS